MFTQTNESGVTLAGLLASSKRWFAALNAATALALPGAHAQTYELNAGGQLDLYHQPGPVNYKAGFSFYCAAWPLMADYPQANDDVQTGLYGTWLSPVRPRNNGHYTTIEGGIGWWRDHNFQTATPKFSMGGVAWGNDSWWFANGPGNGSDGGNGKYGVAQLSSSLLFPPDGLNLRQGTSGKLLGCGYMALPLTEPKTTTAGQAIPTGNHSWTLFMNTGNFKGPAVFFTPYFWSQVVVQNPQWSGETFDTSWADTDKGFAMETQGAMRCAAYDVGGDTFIRSMPIYYPVDSKGYSQLLHRSCVYSQDALWNDVQQWLASSGTAPRGIIKSGATFLETVTASQPEWDMKTSSDTDVGKLDWTGIVGPAAPNAQECGYKWKSDLVTIIPSANGALVKLPEYYKGPSNPNSASKWVPIAKADMPASAVSALAGVEFDHPIEHVSLVPYDRSDPVWTSPGPVSGPSVALLGDGSFVTYYWYRFADQPTLQKADMSLAERNRIQIVCEKIHREWKNDRDYIAPPTASSLADLDPGVLVTPPLGLEYGYVPIAWRQDWGGSVASPGALNFTSVPTNPAAGTAFSVTVRALNASGVAQNVTANTQVKLSVASGYGTLAGNTTGKILNGTSSVTITGITYSAADTMTLTAAATCLSPTTSTALTFANPSGKVNVYNKPATAMSETQATLNAALGCLGTNANVQVYWGLYNGGITPAAWANSATVGSWSNASSTNLSNTISGLQPNTVYYYNFQGTNASGSTWASKVLSFKTVPPATATLTWDANGTAASVTDGDGQWASDRWWNGTSNVNWSDNNDAKIGSGGAGGIISLGEVVVRNITFAPFSGTYTLVNGVVTLGGALTFDSSGSAKLTSVIEGTGVVTKNGSGTLTMDGVTANTYSGGTIINSGTLTWGTLVAGLSPDCSSACGTGPVTLNSGGTLNIQRANPINVLTLNGGKLLATNGWGANWQGPVTVNSNTIIVPEDCRITLSGDVSGAGGFTKTGNGTVNLSGSNTYSGDTLLQSGKLSWQRAASVSPGSLLISSGAMAQLDYVGTRIVKKLSLNGVVMGVGTYGSTASPASIKNDSYFSGTGTITLVAEITGLPVSSGLVLRLDASQITGTADGAQLNTWTDTSGAANNAVRQSASSSGYPKYVANGRNGLPVVRFNSANNNPGDFMKFNRLSTIRTVFWVLKENAGLTDTHFLLGDSSTFDFYRGPTPNGPLWDGNFSSANIRSGATKLMGNLVNGTTTSLPSENFQLVSLVTLDNVAADQICQDRTFHGSWQGDIAEILIYNRALTSTEEAAVGTYLTSKYALMTTYPSPVMPANYAAWANNSSQGLTVATNGPMDDPDRDGISNMLEFVFGGAPMVHSRAILPALSKAGSGWFLEYSRSDLAEATTQAVEYSSDLKVWTAIQVSPNPNSAVAITAGSPSDRIKVAIPAGSGKPTFARLKVSQ